MLSWPRDGDLHCFRRGELVEVRSAEEILRSLDAEGKLEGMPFMPEMLACCGRVFRVHRRAEKTCVEVGGMHRLKGTVLLEDVRCDGAAHEGCERGCLIFWKDAWLKPASAEVSHVPPEPRSAPAEGANLPVRRDGRFVCQSTELIHATTSLVPWWDARQYLRDLTLGQATVREMAWQLWLLGFNKARGWLNRRRPAATGNRTHPTPTATLGLQPGELVEVKRLPDIEATLDAGRRNRGLEFTPDMEQHCGKQFRVLRRVTKIIVETTGQMRNLRDSVILQGVACDGVHARGCPRANLSYWREVWLRRVPSSEPVAVAAPVPSCLNVLNECQVPCK